MSPVRTHAFATPLRLHVDEPLPGLPPAAVSGGSIFTEVTEERGGALRPTAPSERILEQRLPDGTLSVSCDRSDDGYALETALFGRFHVSRDGLRVAYDAQDAPPWRWQRMLLGHALPLAAIARGTELLHAGGAVAPDGSHAVAVHASSHGGKTSVTVQLVRRGWSLLTDDGLAFTPGRPGEAPLAHPGGATATVRRAEAALIDADGGGWPGTVVARDEDSVRLLLERGAVAPLRAVYRLDHRESVPRTRFSPFEPTVPELLAMTFNFALREPARLARMLDSFAHLAAGTTFVRVAVGDGVGAAALAEQIERDARTRLA